jgi:hypothetical protein
MVEQWTMSSVAFRFYVITGLQDAERPITVVLKRLTGARRKLAGIRKVPRFCVVLQGASRYGQCAPWQGL